MPGRSQRSANDQTKLRRLRRSPKHGSPLPDSCPTGKPQEFHLKPTSADEKDLEKANAPNDPTLKTNVDRAAGEQTNDATKLSQTQSDYDAAKTERDNAQSKLDDTQNQKDSLPAKLAAAQQALSDAQTAVAAERRKMFMAAQAESAAFAFARDNTPFMYAMADASSSNPAKRVMLYAFNDSKTIFMRGKREDLDDVKRIIAAFDQPAPQARLTLWTFELSAEAGQKANKGSARKLNEAMSIIDQELSDTRALQNTTLTLLRELINDRVRAAASANPLPPCPATDCETADRLKLSRLWFYDTLVLQQLNFDPRAVSDSRALDQLRRLIPDPAGTTTLGEALLVLSLAPPAARTATRNDFESAIVGRLRALPISSQVQEQTKLLSLQSCPAGAGRCFLPLTWHSLGIWEGDPLAGLTSQELEITRALKSAYDNAELERSVAKLDSWFEELPTLSSQMGSVQQKVAALETKASQGRQAPQNLTGSDKTKWIFQGLGPDDQLAYRQQHEKLLALQARQQTIEHESVNVVDQLRRRGYDVGDILSKVAAAQSLGDPTLAAGTLREVKAALAPIISAATPCEAAADEMLKAMIIAVEDDLDRAFMQPMVRGLPERLIADAGVNVGIMQRESTAVIRVANDGAVEWN